MTIKNYMAQVPCILVEHHSMGDIIIIQQMEPEESQGWWEAEREELRMLFWKLWDPKVSAG